MPRRPTLLATVAAVLAACGGSSTDRTTTAGAPPRQTPALAKAAALEHVPHDAHLVAAVGSLTGFADRIGRDALVDEYRALYERAVADIVGFTGHNLLDPAAMPEVGLDPARPWGFALIGDEPAVAVFAPVTDEDKLKTLLYRLAPAMNISVDVEALGAATVISGERDRDVAAVLVDGFAFFIVSDKADAANIARRIATLPVEASMARDDAVRTALDRLGVGADLAVYSATDPVAAMLGHERSSLPMALGADLSGDAIRFELVATDAPAWLPLARAPGAHVLQRAATGHPLALLTVSVEPAAALRSPLMAPLVEEVRRYTEVDLAADLAPIATGEVGVAVVSEVDRDRLASEPMPDHIGFHAVIGVTDEARAAAVVDRFVESSPLAGRAERSADGRWVIGGGDDLTVHIDVASGYIAATTDAALFDRLAAGGEQSGAAVRLELDALALGYLVIPVVRHEKTSVRAAVAADPAAAGEQAPYSEAYREIERELEAARDEVYAMEDRMRRVYLQRELAFVSDLGVLSVGVERTRGGLVARGSYRPLGGAAGLIRTLVSFSTDRYQAGVVDDKRYVGAYERIYLLEQKLAEQRAKDVDQWLKQRASKPVVTKPAPTTSSDKALIQRVVRKHLAKFRYCYESALQHEPNLAGTVRAEFTIGPNGRVVAAKASGMGSKRVEACVVRQLKRLTFPKPSSGGIVKISYPFRFQSAP